MVFIALACLVFALVLFGVQIGTVDMVVLGLLLFALGHIFGGSWTPWNKTNA